MILVSFRLTLTQRRFMETRSKITIEACVNSVQSAIEAQRGGALRVELCDNLYDGGTTPSSGAIEAARKYLDIALNVIIRPRGADFLYSDIEFETMKSDIVRSKELGADGVVFGFLDADGAVNKEQTQEMVELAGPMSTTFHRAFDMTRDPFEAIEDLAGVGVDRILTSGQRPSAMEGIELLADLVEKAADRIVIMPGVGIDETNIETLVKKTKAREFHVLSEKMVTSLMRYKNEKVFMGSTPDPSEYETPVTDHEGIRAICQAGDAAVPGAE